MSQYLISEEWNEYLTIIFYLILDLAFSAYKAIIKAFPKGIL